MRETEREVPGRDAGAELGPWGEAIQYWLVEKKVRQADLAQWTQIQAKTISRVARGHDTQTRVLRVIAAAFGIPLDLVLVSPLRRGPNGARSELVQKIVADTLRLAEEASDTEKLDGAVVALARRVQSLTLEQRRAIEGVIVQIEKMNDHAASSGRNPSTLPGEDGTSAARRRRT